MSFSERDDYAQWLEYGQKRGWLKPNYAGVGPKNYKRPDAAIEDEIHDKLKHNRDLDASDIVVAVKNGDRDDGAPDYGDEEWPRDQKAPGDEASDHSYPDRSFHRALHEDAVAIRRFREGHGVAPDCGGDNRKMAATILPAIPLRLEGWFPMSTCDRSCPAAVCPLNPLLRRCPGRARIAEPKPLRWGGTDETNESTPLCCHYVDVRDSRFRCPRAIDRCGRVICLPHERANT